MTDTAKWSGYFKIVTPQHATTKMTDSQEMADAGAYNNHTWYQRLIQGSASRMTRYREYSLMNTDIDVSRALDTIAEEMTGNNPKSKEPLIIDVLSEDEDNVDSVAVLTLKAALRRWGQIHKFNTRLYRIARHTIMYGDVFFRKQKTNYDIWQFIHPQNVVAAIVDVDDATKIVAWQIKTDIKKPRTGGYGLPMGAKETTQHETEIVSAKELIRFSLSDDMSDTQPFGESVLRPVYRSHKQKELLEDAIIIYRIQRAPERRVFYIDVGKMPPQRVKQYLESIKNEIKQKKVPTMNGGQSEIDSVYNPQSMCLALNTKIPLLDGRTETLQTLITEYNDGKENWVYSINPDTGEIVPGPISWAGITQENTETIKLTLDNGEEIICTPEHKFPIQGKGFDRICAKDLTENDSLWQYNTTSDFITTPTGKTSGKYTKIYNPSTKGYTYVHRLVANYMKELNEHSEFVYDSKYANSNKRTIHHKNFLSKDNSPSNLVWMNSTDHSLYHMNLNPNQEASFPDEMIRRFIELTTHNIHIKFKDLLKLLNSDEQFMSLYAKANIPKTGTKYKLKVTEFRQKMFLVFIKNVGFKNWKEYQQYIIQSKINVDVVIKKLKVNDKNDVKLLQYIFRLIKNIGIHNFKLVNHLKSNKLEWDNFCSVYENVFDSKFNNRYKKLNVPEASMFERIAKHFEYDNFKHLVAESANFNHRVVKIEQWNTQDVGTLTIDKKEKYHKNHTFALSSGVFTFNSEDFFFACLSMNSEVILLDGRTLTIDELRKEYEEGKTNQTYSIDQQTGKKIIGNITWAGFTRQNAEMVRVHLNNNTTIDCTPDHKFIIDTLEEIQAQELKSETLLASFDNQLSVIKVEKLDYREDTGCIHVEDDRDNHNFALAAGVYVKNSRPDGRGSRVDTLPGGQGLGELTDLEYFKKKVWRGLKIPVSYMTDQGDGGQLFNDGKVGLAYIEELRFSLYVERLQGYLESTLDAEFKMFLRQNNIHVDESMYRVMLPEPSNFGKYKQLEIDSALLGTYASADGIAHLSPRFAMKRFLQLSDEEIITNERMKREELGLDPDSKDEADLQTLYGDVAGAEGAMGAGALGGGFGGTDLGLGTETAPGTEAPAGTETPPTTK